MAFSSHSISPSPKARSPSSTHPPASCSWSLEWLSWSDDDDGSTPSEPPMSASLNFVRKGEVGRDGGRESGGDGNRSTPASKLFMSVMKGEVG